MRENHLCHLAELYRIILEKCKKIWFISTEICKNKEKKQKNTKKNEKCENNKKNAITHAKPDCIFLRSLISSNNQLITNWLYYTTTNSKMIFLYNVW